MDHAYANMHIKAQTKQHLDKKHKELQSAIRAIHELDNVENYQRRLMRTNKNKELAEYQLNQMGTQEWREDVPIKNSITKREADQPN